MVTGEADLILYLVDGTCGVEGNELDAREADRTILLWSKADCAPSPPKGFLAVSALTGEGFAALEEEIRHRLVGTGPGEGEAVIDSVRQRDLLARAHESLNEVLLGARGSIPLDALAVDLRDVLDALGEITGEVTSLEVLEEMFSRFCVGK